MSSSLISYGKGVVYIEQAVTVQAAAYASGDLVGGKLTLTDPKSGTVEFPSGGLIQSVIITDLAKQNITKDVFFFDTNPANTTFTENGALAVADADLVDLIGVAQVADWYSLSDNSVGQVLNLALPFVLPGASASLYAAIVERGAPTYVSTADLTIRVGILPA